MSEATNTPESPVKVAKRNGRPQEWSIEQSREMAKRSAEVRAAKKAELDRTLISLALEPTTAKPTQKPSPMEPDEPELPTEPPAGHRERRLARVRRQLDRLDAMLLREKDAAKLDRLAAASAKLEEQERRLSDRSLPAVVKAEPQRRGRLPMLLDS